MADHNELGKKGEQIAADQLQQKGYLILSRNFRFSHLELDIIAQKDDELVIVEVKTRQSAYLTDPTELISRKKQKDLIKAANHYIDKNQVDLECRFDLIIIVLNKDKTTIEHIEDAFYPVI